MAEVKEVPAANSKVVEPETGEKVGGVLKVMLHEFTVVVVTSAFTTYNSQVPSFEAVKLARVLMRVPAGTEQPPTVPSGI
jgi:hypothetical protein